MRFLLAAIPLLFPLSGAAEEIPVRGIAWPALSPDGSALAFEWLNDIWLAPSAGGEAVRIVKSPAREAYPMFSPDGGRIYFGSQASGSVQLHSVKTDGSDPRIHTQHTGGNIPEAIAADGSFAIVRGVRDSSGYEPFRLLKVDLDSDARELELFDATAHSVSVSPCGKRFLFCRGGEQLYRQGYRGSRASSIHLYDSAEKRFTSVVSEESEARSPLWKPDGKSFYYVSSREGSSEVWEGGFGGKPHRRLTSMGDGGVVLPDLSADGKVMVFRSGQEVYRFEPESSAPPVAVRFFTEEQLPDRSKRKERVTGTSSSAFSADGGRIVFSSAGDLWTMAAGESSPRRMTATDETDEREPALSADGKEVLFLRDDGLKAEVCRAGWDAGKLGEIGVIASSGRSKRSLKVSPCGRRVAWLEATGNLVTAALDGGAAKTVAEAWDTPTYDWSPDGEWLVMSAKDVHSNRDIFLVPADGSRPPLNLTRHPAFEGSPKFSPDGKSIVFTARREPDGIAGLWLMDVVADPEKIAASLRPLDTDIGEPTRVTWAADSRSVLFQSRDADDKTIYSVPLDGGQVAEFSDFRGIAEGMGADGRSFWRIDRVPTVFHEGKLTRFEFSFSVEQERPQRLRLGFRRIWRTLGERFYDGTMNGKDWPAILAKYEDAAAAAMDSRQFDRVVAQLLGELNASHLTFKTTPWGAPSQPDAAGNPTAFPGLTFRNSWEGPLVIEKVLEGSPISLVEGAPVPGETVRRIGGKKVDARTPLHTVFNGAKGVAFPIVVASKAGAERTLELIPVSYGRARWLDRAARLKRAELAAAGGGKRIAYLPFRKMKSDDLLELATEVYRASLDADGLILDLRDNVGGRVADQLLGLFCQPVHTFTIPRGGERGYPVDRRVSPAWDGPMVVLCNENTYSNAEIFCHAFKRLGRGKLVGMPTNGGVISAVTIRIPEVGELQIPFRGWFHADTGRDLELNGAVPDLLVPIGPQQQADDLDPQLDAALRSLEESIAAKGPEIPAILKSSE
jgi:tricorn protease